MAFVPDGPVALYATILLRSTPPSIVFLPPRFVAHAMTCSLHHQHFITPHVLYETNSKQVSTAQRHRFSTGIYGPSFTCVCNNFLFYFIYHSSQRLRIICHNRFVAPSIILASVAKSFSPAIPAIGYPFLLHVFMPSRRLFTGYLYL